MTREQKIGELEQAITANDEYLQKVEATNDALGWLEGYFQMNIDCGGKHACPYCYLSNDSEPWETIKHADDCLIGKALK